jgi:pimeloyl-ACP methyl ester carboxylesterase
MATVSPDQTYVKCEGGSRHYVVLLHGHGLNKTYFGPLCRMLREANISHMAIDLPGYGFARDVDCSDYDEIADYICGILERERIETMVLAGYSYGGFISLVLNGRLRDRVKGLILMASSYEVTFRSMRLSFALLWFPLYTAINEITWLFYKEGQEDFDFSDRAMRAGNLAMVRHSSVATSRRNILKNAGIMRRRSLRNLIEQVRVPTLIIQPRRCQFFSRRSYDYMAATIPGAVRHVTDTPHNVAPAWETMFHCIQEFLPATGA